jgi:hypothetical protein
MGTPLRIVFYKLNRKNGIFVQVRAEPSLLELCRAPPKIMGAAHKNGKMEKWKKSDGERFVHRR